MFILVIASILIAGILISSYLKTHCVDYELDTRFFKLTIKTRSDKNIK